MSPNDHTPDSTSPLGPRPAGPRADPATQMSKARAAVLEQLGRHSSPTTVGVLAAECGQHTNTVREHLDALASAGLVVRSTGTAQGRGRPAIRYAAVPPESARPQMRQYVNLVSALAGQIGRTMPDARAFAVEAGRMVQQEEDSAPTTQSAADASLHLLSDLGFDPSTDEEAENGPAEVDAHGRPVLEVRLHECPMLEAARRHPDVVCSVHLGALLGAYETRGESTDGVRVVPFAEPGACLAYLPVSDAGQDEDSTATPARPRRTDEKPSTSDDA